MIRLPDVRLPESAQTELDHLQEQINRIPDYALRVEEAKRQFSSQNKATNPIFRSVRRTLTELCSGARRCCYCEDSAADEVEHVRPKDLYPEFVFVWENYVYACGPCNGPKNNQYAVFSSTTGNLTPVTRARHTPIVPPEPGDPALIDPRTENALDFMALDLRDTFFYLPLGSANSREYQRAVYTITILRLNERDFLPVARAEAYRSYRARLVEYIRHRDGGAVTTDRDNLINALKRMGHPTVWQEMKRQQTLLPDLKRLFDEAPEALAW